MVNREYLSNNSISEIVLIMVKNIYKSQNKFSRILSTIILNIVLAFLITIVFGFASGYKVLTIISGSMTPTMPKGTAIIIKNIDISQVEVNDVITFMQGESKVTHRVVEKNVDEQTKTVLLKTQGDAAENQGSHESVTKNNFVGVVVCHVVGLGNVFEIIKKNIIMITICIVLALFIVTYA